MTNPAADDPVEIERLLATAFGGAPGIVPTEVEAQIQAFLRQAGTLVIEPLGRACHSRDPKTRMKAVTYLGQIRRAECVPSLVGALADTDPRVRTLVVISLGECGDPSAVDALLGVLDDDDQRLRGLAADAFARITNHAPGVDVLAGADARRPALVALSAWWREGAPRDRDALWAAGFRASGYAVAALPLASDDHVGFEALLGALGDSRPWLRRNAEAALARATGVTRTLDDELAAAPASDSRDYALVRQEAVARLRDVYRRARAAHATE